VSVARAHAAKLPGWFKPVYGLDGGFYGIRHMLILADGFDAGPPKAGSKAHEPFLAPPTEPVTRVPDHFGHAVFVRQNGVKTVACGYYIDLVSNAYPSCTWNAVPDDELGPLRAYVDDECVGVVMPIRGQPEENSEPLDPPPCPACDGKGRTEKCDECRGDGVLSVTCDVCDHEHEHDCPKCSGNGWVKRCEACAGTGEWKPEHDEARR
jgi:hypothetical protein